MTEAERKAMEWLDDIYHGACCAMAGQHVATLKAMLAEPRLPKEPTQEIVAAMWASERTPSAIYHRLYTHLTAPKTKEVDVWHVEWSDGDIPHTDDPYLQREHAEMGADRRRVEGRGQCIRVTGPHKHRVSA